MAETLNLSFSIKVSGGTPIRSGAIILRQRGLKYVPSTDGSVGKGRDHTLFAKIDGKVVFERRNQRRRVLYQTNRAPNMLWL